MPPTVFSPGKFDKLITVQTMTSSQDTYGGPTETASTYVQLWAEVVPAGAGESFQAGQQQGRRTLTFRTRYYAGVTSKHRISWDSRTFDIQDVVNVDEANRWLEITATERGT